MKTGTMDWGWCSASEETTFVPMCWGCDALAVGGLCFSSMEEVVVWLCETHMAEVQAALREIDGGDPLEPLARVVDERLRQRVKWGWDDEHDVGLWLAILGKQTGRLAEEALDPYFSPAVRRPNELAKAEAERLRDRLAKIAAVAVAFMEQLDERLRTLDGVERARHIDPPEITPESMAKITEMVEACEHEWNFGVDVAVPSSDPASLVLSCLKCGLIRSAASDPAECDHEEHVYVGEVVICAGCGIEMTEDDPQ